MKKLNKQKQFFFKYSIDSITEYHARVDKVINCFQSQTKYQFIIIKNNSKYNRSMRLTKDKIAHLTIFFSQHFLKSSLSHSQVSTLLQNAQLISPTINTELFHQGAEINQYFFLIQGIVQLHKSTNKIDNNFNEIILLQSGKIIGQYFTTQHHVRQYTAQVKVQCTQIIKIEKQYFDSFCHSFVSQYNQIDKYAHQVLHISKKINSFDIFTAKLYTLGSHINLNSNQIGVIFNGQCKILYKPHHNPRKCSLPSIVKPKLKTNIKQIALISESEWIFTQNLEEQQIQSNQKFIYMVTSEILKLLIMPTPKIDILPQTKVDSLHLIATNRKTILQNSHKFPLQQNQRPHIIKSPRELKYSIDYIKKMLQKLDPNSSPNFVLQQHHAINNHLIKSNQHQAKSKASLIQQSYNIFHKHQFILKYYQPYSYKAKKWSNYSKQHSYLT